MYLLFVAVVGLVSSGCYTQFATIDPPAQYYKSDSTTVDSGRVAKRVDTITTRDREVCVWERDLLGFPRLRCYNTLYHRDWHVYHRSPWWYRNDPFWHDYGRCPRYYVYDPTCGCCYLPSDPFYRPPLGGGSPSAPPSPRNPGEPLRPRTYGVPSAPVPGTGSSIQEGQPKKSVSPPETPAAPKDNRSPLRPRTYGVPTTTTIPVEQVPSLNLPKSAAEPTPQSNGTPAPEVLKQPSVPPATNDKATEEQKPKNRRKSRSW